MSIVFGPVPSRRLGNSMGINNIPPKECTYACVYCQLGNTIKLEIERREFYSPQEIYGKVKLQLNSLDDKVDYLTFVPDGEPTLDLNLGKSIDALKNFGVKIAVITNSSLIFDKKVHNDLKKADWVSIKIDTITEDIWRKINRPHGKLNYADILKGIKVFSSEYEKYLVTETMLVKDINDNAKEIEKIGDFISELNVAKSYISIPTRPPAVSNIEPPKMEKINDAFQIFVSKGINAELLIGYEGNRFSSSGDFKNDILNISAVHPLREDAVEQLLIKSGSTRDELNKLIRNMKIKKVLFNGEVFYLRNLRKFREELNEQFKNKNR